MSKDFILVPAGDPIVRLRSSFPDVWTDILDLADPDTPFLMYSAFATLLLQRRGDPELWKRAYRFFSDVATDSTMEFALTGAFEALCDSDIPDAIEKQLGPAARAIFRSCRLGA